MQLISPATQKYDIGRAAIFRRDPWDGTGSVFTGMVHIGNTEGAVEIEPNPEYSELTLPETSGPAALKRYLTGERPSFELGIFPNPANLKIFSPTGRASAGQRRRRGVREHLLWIVPEELFIGTDEKGNSVEVPVTFAAGAFKKADKELTADEQALVDMSMLIWRADFGRATPRFVHEDGGKSLRSVPVTLQQDFDRPDGCQLYLMVGEASEFDIDLSGD